jgi:uncharacterized membrane protein YphA (DoxX/SURF4 family)
MSKITGYFAELGSAALSGWNRFWFTPADPATLGLIRIFAGSMLFYTHLVWSLDLEAFFGLHAWISPAAAKIAVPDGYNWSHLWLINSSQLLWAAHLMGLAVFAMFTLGLFTRVTSILSCLIAIAYVHRVPGALFGLDQINCMLAMYLAIGPSGDAFSLDRWLKSRRAAEKLPPAAPSTSANLAMRLIQIHMCVIYFFAGISKLQGNTWWEGTALWYAFANLEYQSLDMTWMAGWPISIAIMTQTTVYWELSFCVLIWPRLLRPIVLLVAIPLHLGIGICMGMMTFGLVMLIGCFSFVSPAIVRGILDRQPSTPPLAVGAGEGRGAAPRLSRKAARAGHVALTASSQ